MRIVFFTESYKPYLSGVTVSIDNLAKHLTLRGHRVWIISPDYPRQKKVLSKIIRLPSLASRRYPGFRLALPFLSGIYKKLKIISPDILHTHSSYTLGILAKKYGRRLKIPVVYTFHTVFSDYLHYFPFLPKKAAGFLLKKYFQWFLKDTPVVVPTNFTKQLADQFKPGPLAVIPSGIELQLIKAAPVVDLKKVLGLDRDKKIFLYVGRLSREKNISFLLGVMAEILKARNNIHLLIVASGPEESNLKNLAQKLKIAESVTFKPQVPQAEIFSYYQGADLFVCASTSETQGMVLIEAMAAGLPVVAIDAKGVSDIINPEVGFLVKENVEEFCGRVLEIVDQPELSGRMRAAARAAAQKEYSAQTAAEKIEDFYKRLLKK